MRRRLARLGVIAALVAGAVVLIAVFTSGVSGSPRPHTTAARTTEQQVEALLAGITQGGNTLGSPLAPVTLQWFGDLECPFCRQFALGALVPIIRKWVRSGELKIEYRSMQTATRQPAVFADQQVAALAAGMQGKMWNFIELFYHQQREEDSGYVTESYLQGIASEIPSLSLADWSEDRDRPQLALQVAEDKRAVHSAHFSGTPSFLIGRSGGPARPLAAGSLTSPDRFDEAIEELLER